MLKKILIVLAGLFVVLIALAIVFDVPRFVIGLATYGGQVREGSLQVGDPVPEIVLHDASGESTRELSEWIGERPLVLIFGSFTWPPFRRSVGRLHEIYDAYRDRAGFLTIYIKEAHPEDEWQMGVNEREGVCYMQPTTLAERCNVASAFISDSEYRIPLVVDGMDNAADEAFAGWPERLYVIGADGRIAYKGRTGPFGFKPGEVEAWLAKRIE